MTLKHHTKIGILGSTGRVGRLLVSELQNGQWPTLTFAGGTSRDTDPEDLFTRSDVLIDFTTPEATAKHIWLAAKHHKPIVIGTTGLNAAQEQELHDTARECAIVYAANTSIGVNLLLALIKQTAATLGPEWDIEISETHHRHKKDSPSGTALALGRAAASGRNHALKNPSTDREGTRESGAIGFAVQRGGDIVGEHTITFFGAGERVSLNHIATDRAIFARGALTAAQWLVNKPFGLYSMADVLRLQT